MDHSRKSEAYLYPFLGKGWSFPPEFTGQRGALATTSGAHDIHNSLLILLATQPGERKMAPEFGVDLSPLLFETLDLGLETRIADSIERAILRFEPRVLLEDITFRLEVMEGILYISLYYLIQTTNSRTNLVFPYYLTEGTDL